MQGFRDYLLLYSQIIPAKVIFWCESYNNKPHVFGTSAKLIINLNNKPVNINIFRYLYVYSLNKEGY